MDWEWEGFEIVVDVIVVGKGCAYCACSSRNVKRELGGRYDAWDNGSALFAEEG